jgi:hypothetical protein
MGSARNTVARDARWRATVVLPTAGEGLEGELHYELELVVGGSGVRLASEPADRCFAIETDEPHMQVAWRVTARQEATAGPKEE